MRNRSVADLNALLIGCVRDQLTYGPTGSSLENRTPDGLARRQWQSDLGGGDAFARGVAAIRAWSVHRGAGLAVATDGPLAAGTNVALCAPLPIGFVDATCRVVAIIDEPARFGFAYGTLSVHPERGEESFVLTRDQNGRVRFDIVAVSRPVHPLARRCLPIADRLQDAAARRYLAAMRVAVANAA